MRRMMRLRRRNVDINMSRVMPQPHHVAGADVELGRQVLQVNGPRGLVASDVTLAGRRRRSRGSLAGGSL